MEFGQLMIDILVNVSCKFEMYIFKFAQVISENVRIAFLYVLSIHVNRDSKKEGSEYLRHYSGESAQCHFLFAAAAKFLHPRLKDLLL